MLLENTDESNELNDHLTGIDSVNTNSSFGANFSASAQLFLNKIAFVFVNDFFSFSNLCFDHLNHLAANLQAHCVEAPFETKILICLCILFLVLFTLILFFGYFYGELIEKFSENPGNSFFN